MRRKVKRLLRKHGYPPDKREEAVITVIEQAETLCRDWAEIPSRAEGVPSVGEDGKVLPFRRLEPEEVRPFDNCVPLYELAVAAGRFSEEQVIEEVPRYGEIENPEDYEWVAINSRVKPNRGLFVAQVIGESMNRRVPNESWCLFRLNPSGTLQGKVVLAQHRDIQDPEFGGEYTLKLYASEKEPTEDGSWRHKSITLRPDSTDPTYVPIVLHGLQEGELTIIAELVEVL